MPKRRRSFVVVVVAARLIFGDGSGDDDGDMRSLASLLARARRERGRANEIVTTSGGDDNER